MQIDLGGYSCMVLIGKGRLGPDIWPKTPQQAESNVKYGGNASAKG